MYLVCFLLNKNSLKMKILNYYIETKGKMAFAMIVEFKRGFNPKDKLSSVFTEGVQWKKHRI